MSIWRLDVMHIPKWFIILARLKQIGVSDFKGSRIGGFSPSLRRYRYQHVMCRGSRFCPDSWNNMLNRCGDLAIVITGYSNMGMLGLPFRHEVSPRAGWMGVWSKWRWSRCWHKLHTAWNQICGSWCEPTVSPNVCSCYAILQVIITANNIEDSSLSFQIFSILFQWKHKKLVLTWHPVSLAFLGMATPSINIIHTLRNVANSIHNFYRIIVIKIVEYATVFSKFHAWEMQDIGVSAVQNTRIDACKAAGIYLDLLIFIWISKKSKVWKVWTITSV